MERRRKPNGTAHDPVRSVRVSNLSWSGAQKRATAEGRTMSAVVSLLVQGYAEGQVNLPTIQLVYTPGPTPAANEPPASAASQEA